MTDPNTSSTTRRRLMESVATVGLAGLVGGAGTWAAFGDVEIGGTTLAAGTLDLKVTGGDTQQTLTVADVEPGSSGTETVGVSNDGSIPGTLGVTLHLLSCATEDEDSVEDRACEWDPDTDNSEVGNSGGGSGGDDLADHMEVRIGFDRDGSGGGADADVLVDWTTVRSLSFPSSYGSDHTLHASGHAKDSSTLFLEWRIDDVEAVRGESLGFGITVNLTQA